MLKYFHQTIPILHYSLSPQESAPRVVAGFWWLLSSLISPAPQPTPRESQMEHKCEQGQTNWK